MFNENNFSWTNFKSSYLNLSCINVSQKRWCVLYHLYTNKTENYVKCLVEFLNLLLLPLPPHLWLFLLFLHPQLILNDRTIPITTGSADGVNIANSAHPCVESPCANGGTCRPKWDNYECDCPLGYDGRHCQKGQLHTVCTSIFLQNWLMF